MALTITYFGNSLITNITSSNVILLNITTNPAAILYTYWPYVSYCGAGIGNITFSTLTATNVTILAMTIPYVNSNAAGFTSLMY